MNKKNYISKLAVVILSFSILNTINIFAHERNNDNLLIHENFSYMNDTNDIAPYKEIEDDFYLSTTSWKELSTGKGGLFLDRFISVINSANNDGDIKVRIVDSDGNIIKSAVTIELGEEVNFRVDNSEKKYIVQAKAVDVEAYYRIVVNDTAYNGPYLNKIFFH